MKIKQQIIKILLTLIFVVAYTFASELNDLYNVATTYYNNKEYEKAEPLIIDLIEKKHDNPLIYFMLGKIYRKHPNKNLEAIENLEKFVSLTTNEEEAIFGKINLAYEYLRVWNITNLDISKKIIDEINGTKYDTHPDFTYCFATVYNSYGFYLIKNASEDEDWEYYKDAASYFEQAIKKRPELPTIANNLVVAYIKVLEKGVPENLKKRYYIKVENILTAPRYTKTSNALFKKTKDYFKNNIAK